MNSGTWDIKYLIKHKYVPKFNSLFQKESRLNSMTWSLPYMVHEHYQGHGTKRNTLPSHEKFIPQRYAAKVDIDGQLKSAILSKKTETAVNLIRGGANTSILIDGRPLLQHVIMKNQEDIMRCCIDHGADRNAVDNLGRTMLHFAVENSNINTIEVLLDYIDVNIPDSDGFTPLFYAMVSKSVDVFYLLLQKGADVNVPNNLGDTPLHMSACLSLSLWKIKVLLQHGADVHLKNKDGDTALDVALRRSKRYLVSDSVYHIINLLLAWGSGVDETNAMVVNYLAFDINCELQTLSRVLEDTNGANCQDAQKLTPLHYVVFNNRTDLAELLVEKGAEIDARDCHGETPLHFGVAHDCSAEIVMFLLRMGANVSSDSTIVRNALTRKVKKVKEYLLDFENDLSPFLDGFTSKSNCKTHFYCFAELIKYLPAVDCAKFYLAFK